MKKGIRQAKKVKHVYFGTDAAGTEGKGQI